MCAAKHSANEILSIEVRDISPIMGEKFYRVYYFDSIIVYQPFSKFETYEDQLVFDSSSQKIISNPKLKSEEWQHYYFIFHKDSIYGKKYQPHKLEKSDMRVKVDSVLTFIQGTNRYDSFLRINPDTVLYDKSKTELREVYNFPKSEDMPNGRLIFNYSKKLKDLKFSLNPIVDKTRNMKLYKIETHFEAFYDKKNKRHWPAMKDVTEMRVIKIKDTVMAKYIHEYKRSARLN